MTINSSSALPFTVDRDSTCPVCAHGWEYHNEPRVHLDRLTEMDAIETSCKACQVVFERMVHTPVDYAH